MISHHFYRSTREIFHGFESIFIRYALCINYFECADNEQQKNHVFFHRFKLL